MYTGAIGGFYRISEWIMRFAYLNILWIAFTLLGLIVFGFTPATTSLFAIVRKWVQGKTDIPIFKTFWKNYKKEFFKSNLLGIIFFTFGYILFLDFQLVIESTNSVLQLTYIPLIVLIIVYILTLLYIFPVYAHYDVSIIYVLKNAFLIMLMRPLTTIIMIVGTGAVYLLIRFIPGLIPFFTVSLWAYIMMWSSHRVFKKLVQQQQVP